MKKGLYIFLIFIMMFLVGCGNEGTNKKEDKNGQPYELEENKEAGNPVVGYQFLGITLEMDENGQVKIKEVYNDFIDNRDNHRIWNGYEITKWNGKPIKEKLKELTCNFDDEDENRGLQRALRTIILREKRENPDKDNSIKIQYRKNNSVYDVELLWKDVQFTYKYDEAVKSEEKKLLMLEKGLISLEDKYKNYRKAGDELFYYFQEREGIKTAVIKPRDLISWSQEELENTISEINKRTPDVVVLKLEDLIDDRDTNFEILLESLVRLNKSEDGTPVVIEKNDFISASGEKLIKELQAMGIECITDGNLEKLIEPKEEKKQLSNAELLEKLNLFKKVMLDKSSEDEWDEELVIHFKDYVLDPYTRISLEERKYPDELVMWINSARYSRFRLSDVDKSDIVKKYYGLMTCSDDLWRVAVRLKKPVEWELTKEYNPYRYVLKMKIKDEVDDEVGFVILTNDLKGERIGHVEDDIEGSKIVDIGSKTYVQVGIFKDEDECRKVLVELREEFEEYSEWLSFTYKRLEDVEY